MGNNSSSRLPRGVATIVTTLFDVIKTQMMTAPSRAPDIPASMPMIILSILQDENPLALFKDYAHDNPVYPSK
jgi:hypothetical protein